MTESFKSSPPVNLEKYIDHHFYAERPHIRGRRIPIAVIAHNARDNAWTVPQLMEEFTLSQAEVLAALLYYEEHEDGIEAQEHEEQRLKNLEYSRHHEK